MSCGIWFESLIPELWNPSNDARQIFLKLHELEEKELSLPLFLHHPWSVQSQSIYISQIKKRHHKYYTTIAFENSKTNVLLKIFEPFAPNNINNMVSVKFFSSNHSTLAFSLFPFVLTAAISSCRSSQLPRGSIHETRGITFSC